MNLASYINDLLYRYDCVIVPNFGGFITNKVSAKINENTNSIYPPSKKISFNKHLNVNDGLLVNYVATSENISYDKATKDILNCVNSWKIKLQTNTITIGALGSLSLNESKQYIFEPNTKVNYLTDSFGLSEVESTKVDRYKEKVKPLVAVVNKKEKTGIPTFIKYAATAAILLTLGFAGNNMYQQNEQKEILANQEKALEEKIQSATFVISNPLPTIELNVVKEVEKPYHVIAGAFQFPENAKKKVNQLKKKGFKASILGVNKWGLTEVAFESFSDKNKATNALYKIQDTVSKDAWLLIKK